ncbi:MAG: phenylacetate--CoA ligase family protein [Desulfomonilaceae bacterium]
MGNRHGNYWNPYVETLSRDEILSIQLKRFRGLLSYCKLNSDFYRENYRHIEPEDIGTLDDVRKLPLIDKEDLRKSQENMKMFPFGTIAGVPTEEVTTFRQTSGTTGTPVYVPESLESWQWRIEVWCHILWMAGFRETDRVFVPFGYNVYVAFWEGHYAAEKLGCMVVPGGALDTQARISKIRELKATALLNTPTYGLHMAEEAHKMGVDPRGLGIKRMLCAGEPLPQATRKRLESTWGAEVYDHIGGTEPCAWGAMCSERKGLHIMEPFFLVEILDMEDQSREVEEGELGVAVVTPLGRRSFPLIRFNTKDIVRKGKDGCPCGRTSMMIHEVSGRTDHLTKIRGVLFSPVTVEEVIRAEFPEITEYLIFVNKKGIMDEISLKVEPQKDTGQDAVKDTVQKLFQRLKTKTNLRFIIEVAAPDELPRHTLKAKRFIDQRGGA